ncbi:DUF4317 domain-containing protein [Lawsonibacter sp. LCP25S3_G6]|uniref:DUF4317 domain-containing protein n=1 Tax=unclassified Lawsonibacter TaxID=2617946 RepID=UPI003F99C708
MNQKEVSELRRRFRPDKSAISRVYGCYVNTKKEVISNLDESLGLMTQEEVEKYLGLLKKSLSGTLGRNLLDIVFSTQQVADSEEHRLLSQLRSCRLEDGELRQALYQKIIDSLELEENYLILLAHDRYDVPGKGADDEELSDGSETVFSYFVCCICPVKSGKAELGFVAGENKFHTRAPGQIVAPPELGFLFPAFDQRSANIYNALFYTRKTDLIHQEVIDAVFHTQPPMSPADQKEAFQTALSDALEEECSLEVMQAVHEQLRDRIVEHKESRDPEPLTVGTGAVSAILRDCGIPEERIGVFEEQCAQQFGQDAALSPANLIDSGKFEVKSSQATIAVPPEQSYLVETRVIDGRKYFLIPADELVEVNGFGVRLLGGQAQEETENLEKV